MRLGEDASVKVNVPTVDGTVITLAASRGNCYTSVWSLWSVRRLSIRLSALSAGAQGISGHKPESQNSINSLEAQTDSLEGSTDSASDTLRHDIRVSTQTS